MAFSDRLIQVHEQVVHFLRVSRAFALLALSWYAAGLICDDRRAGAHLLYFSRPLTRRDYQLAQLATAATFGLRAVLWPALLILSIAVFSSPDYSFLRQKWPGTAYIEALHAPGGVGRPSPSSIHSARATPAQRDD